MGRQPPIDIIVMHGVEHSMRGLLGDLCTYFDSNFVQILGKDFRSNVLRLLEALILPIPFTSLVIYPSWRLENKTTFILAI